MRFHIVDCFAEQKYQGNQLAVFIPDYKISAGEMQQIAKEMGFSETSFILSDKQENGGYNVRIFTPDVEVPFAGHPTIGTAYIIHKIIEKGKTDKVILNLKAGAIPVTIDNENLIMTQNEPEFGETFDKKTLAEVISINESDIRTDYPIQWVSTGLEAIIVPLKSVDAIEKCRVNHISFQNFIDNYYRCNILVFAEDYQDLRVRVFMDDTGFLEDPATGSANGNLAGYLLKHNYFNKHNIQYRVSQGSEMGRPSVLDIEGELVDGKFTILVGGKAIIVAEGNWNY
ncbi:MAG TPA: PhzF family phenazine biosynthesis protein [Candidatus Merdenecus merdavium]|nr:PhzF family phenazine biosynthesis protein [Candidatus Merdenecus merdavium]